MNQGQEVAAAAVPADEEQQQASTKRLKYSEPDLEITCKGRDGSEKTFERYSSVMAWNSKYFDTLLASEMQESITKKVTLEDVSPDTFELAMELIDDMARAGKATVTDFLKVARFDFRNGLNRCITALVEFMELWHGNLLGFEKNRSFPKKGDMENIIATICIAAETDEERLVDTCKRFLNSTLCSQASIFDVDRIRRIQGFLVNHEERCLNRFFRRYYSLSYERPDISDPEFPRRLAGKLQSCDFLYCLRYQSFGICLRVESKGRQNLMEEKNFTLEYFNNRFEILDHDTYEGSYFRNIRLSQIDESYDEEIDCERFDWCVSFEYVGTTILLALPQSRHIPNPTGRIRGWEQVKGFMSPFQFKITSLETRLDE